MGDEEQDKIMKLLKTLIIFTLLYIGSISTLAQRITYAKAKYDNNWNPYIVTTIYNSSNKTIVAVEFVVELYILI